MPSDYAIANMKTSLLPKGGSSDTYECEVDYLIYSVSFKILCGKKQLRRLPKDASGPYMFKDFLSIF